MAAQQTMKALVLQRSNTPKGQARYDPCPVTSIPRPLPKPNHILVKIQASALNHRDVFIRRGLYPNVQDGWILGADCSGVVVESPDNPNFRPGDKVYFNPSVAPRWKLKGAAGHGNGTMAEYISVHQDIPFKMPEHLSFEEGAAIPLAGLTAWHALALGEITPATAKNKRVLIPGIGGGVAVFALQFAVAMGAECWTTSGSEDKIHKAIKDLGAKGGVNYKSATWPQELEKKVGASPDGLFDAVIDGTSGPHLKQYMRLAKEEGKIVVYGAVAGSESTITMPFIWFKSLQIRGAVLGSRKEYADMDAFIRERKFKPVISQVFNGLENAEGAFDAMRNFTQMGKLVVKIGDSDSSASSSAKL